MMMLKFVE